MVNDFSHTNGKRRGAQLILVRAEFRLSKFAVQELNLAGLEGKGVAVQVFMKVNKNKRARGVVGKECKAGSSIRAIQHRKVKIATENEEKRQDS